jgi:phosphatidate cytidylyltransferase
MLLTRLLVGTGLVALTGLMLLVDHQLPPWYPFLFLLLLGLAVISCNELLTLIDRSRRPTAWLVYVAVVGMVVINWLAHWPVLCWPGCSVWVWILGYFVGVVLASFLVEMAVYREPGTSLNRLALTVWMTAYLGLLPSFLIQLRWPQTFGFTSDANQGTAALALAIFVPKCGDIGAFFTGRFFGRNRMSPLLSPKKTWEGALGGLTAAVLATAVIDALGPASVLGGLWWARVGFGVTVGCAGLLGDLAESLIKRDCRQKDASQSVPGFGGVLDVVDAVIFAAPVAFVWCAVVALYQRGYDGV